MIFRHIGRLLNKPAPQPSPSLRSPAERAVAHIIEDVRRRDSTARLIDFLCDRNGYVREAAVERAAQLDAPALLLPVAVRLNDWVPAVRDQAREAVLQMLANRNPDTDGEVLMQLLLNVQHLKQARRADHTDWIARFEPLFIDVMGARRIADAIDNARPALAQACFLLADRYRLADKVDLGRRGLARKGNVVLAHMAIAMARDLAPQDSRRLYRQALCSTVGPVRAQALRALLRGDDDDPRALAQSMLADRNEWVRLVAGTFLERLGCDVPALYGAHIASADNDARKLNACLAGLAEFQGTAYLDLARAATSDPRARVQAAAYAAWARLAPQEKDVIAERLLASEHRRVRRLFGVLASKLGAYVQRETALPLMLAHGDYGQMLALVKGEPWALLEVIARTAAMTRSDPNFRSRLHKELCLWLGSAVRGYTQPTEQQRAFLRQQTVQQALLELLEGDRPGQAYLKRELSAL
ncbi:hypothetical protein [Massilia sp. YIM B02443]|uniref:hypothetical protein n=1 Tax=Massilia sp. YIM B02443 TaxID=3050127 RepID=UPI0025B6F22A|nr:hypothetical protein [Massilia sp. YIM B02443]MDN4038326.1 hypothetical protein [Massilia sp. YIM B02443]